MEEDEDALLAQAIALSMQENQDAPMADASAAAESAPSAPAPAPASSAVPASASAADIDLAMQVCLRRHMCQRSARQEFACGRAHGTHLIALCRIDSASLCSLFQDPDFINSLLAGVPGADGQSVDVSPHDDTRSVDSSVACGLACLLRCRSHSFSRWSDFPLLIFVSRAESAGRADWRRFGCRQRQQ